MEKKIYIIRKIEMVGNTKIFRMEPKDGKNINFLPGQFAKIIKPGTNEFRPYSIASLPEWNFLEFAIRMVGGKFTSYLDGLKEGDSVEVEGPLGHIGYDEEKKCIFVAAGTGIAPVISMLRRIKENKIDGEFYLFYSNRTKSDTVYFDELKKMSDDGRIKAIFTFTGEEFPGFEKGRISEEMMKKYLPKELGEFKVFMCGKMEMVLSLKEIFERLGVKKENIKFEGWG
ncbi:MAG: FAD-dependent oxidoreductase [Candidatus Anstonellales archaeon]